MAWNRRRSREQTHGSGEKPKEAVVNERVEQLERMVEMMESRPRGLAAQIDAYNAEARNLLERLMDVPEEQRAALAACHEFRNLRLADLLLEESRDLLLAQPMLAEELAALAFQIASQRYESALIRQQVGIRATACILIGAARRLAGDRKGAEMAFGRAAVYLRGAADSPERAYHCQQLAALRRDEGRDDEAAGLLWRAALIYNQGADLLEEAGCLAELGLLFVADDQVDRAILPLARACEVLDLHPDRSLTVLARLGLAVCHARLGEADKAQRLVNTARVRYDRVAGSCRQLALVAWMEGKVASLTGNLKDAPGLINTARKSFLRQERLYDTAFAGLDLAAVLARKGQLESINFLIRDVVEGFSPDVGQRGVLRVLGLVESTLLRGRRAELASVIASATARLRQYRRNPLLVFEGLMQKN
jgi:tetratricopeptide (TPR) repeat protein